MNAASITLFLAGDVMTGRGIDQIVARPLAPEIHEPYVTDAREYGSLVESMSGPVPRGVDSDYIWVDALAEWEHGPRRACGQPGNEHPQTGQLPTLEMTGR
jgi:poly-gamma-glutamate capsule biosynthesis protein CapA/YwtB (metallophosphatase superfamily)